MYAGQYLGRFEIPEFVKEKGDWVPLVSYYPEPPLAARGAMNPWQLERQRLLYELEERNWKTIQGLKSEWAQLSSQLVRAIENYNRSVEVLNSRIAEAGGSGFLQKVGMIGAGLSLVPGVGVAGMVLASLQFIKMGIDMLTGSAKKLQRDIRNWTNQVQRHAEEIDRIQGRMDYIAKTIPELIAQSDTLKSAQQEQVRLDTQQAESAYLTKQAYNMQQASRQQLLVRQAMSAPRRMIKNDLL